MKTLCICIMSLCLLSACFPSRLQASTRVSGTIDSNRTWMLAGSPYVINGSVAVPAGVTLTLEPGVVVKVMVQGEGSWSGTGAITVSGTLRALGTAASPIVFTSSRDDKNGGDSNGDGSATTPKPGDWTGLVFNSSSTGNQLEYVQVLYAGAQIWSGRPGGASVSISTPGLVMTHCLVTQSPTAGIQVRSVKPSINNNTISLTNYPIFLEGVAATAPVSQNGIQNNTHDVVVVNAGSVQTSMTWNTDAPYYLDGGISISSGATLTLPPGMVVKVMVQGESSWSGTGAITVSGTLPALGTAASPIVFTSSRDDKNGGDSNGDGFATIPKPGDWTGLVFNGSSTGNQLEYVQVLYGGAQIWQGTPGGANLRISTSRVAINHCLISQSPTAGIWVSSSAPTISNNSIIGNALFGLFNGTPGTLLHAEQNWWGSSTGPYDPSDDRAKGGLYNPNGKGDRVTDAVYYDPWLMSDPTAKAPPPSISSMSPNSMPSLNENQTLTINGNNFQNGCTLTFATPGGGTLPSAASKLSFVSSSQLSYQFNNANDSGTWSVMVNNPDGQSSSPYSFAVQAPASSFVLGIDISDGAGTVDWKVVRDAGKKTFVFIKASSGVCSQEKANLEKNIEVIRRDAPELLVGAYHFAYPNSTLCTDIPNTGVAEAINFLSVAKNYIGAGFLPPVLDLEDSASPAWVPSNHLTAPELVRWIKDWCDEVEFQTHVTPIIYTGNDYAKFLNTAATAQDLTKYSLWIWHHLSDPMGNPGTILPWSTWTFQQYRIDAEGATCDGILEKVDLDSFNGDLLELRALAGGCAAESLNQSPPASLLPVQANASPRTASGFSSPTPGPGPIDFELLRRFRDQLLARSTQGQSIIDSYYKLSPELIYHFASNPDLRAAAVQAIVSLQPVMQDMVSGTGELIVSSSQISDVNAMLAKLNDVAGVELKSTIQGQVARVGSLDGLAGKTTAQARQVVLGISLHIVNARIGASGGLEFTLTGVLPPGTLHVESSDDLENWTALDVPVVTALPTTLHDDEPLPSKYRYYRVAAAP